MKAREGLKCILVGFEVDAADSEVVATASETRHLCKSLSVGMNCLGEGEGDEGDGERWEGEWRRRKRGHAHSTHTHTSSLLLLLARVAPNLFHSRAS